MGAQYENIAAAYLTEHGYKILDKNYRNSYGEIDIIAEEENGTVIYFEIKFRSSNQYGDPMEAVDIRKQKRISRAAFCHYMQYGYEKGLPCRFDVIAIYGDGELKHIKNAFEFYED